MAVPRSTTGIRGNQDLWHSMPSSAGQAALQSTSNDCYDPGRSSQRASLPLPSISTPDALNKPLPPSPNLFSKRKPLSLRSLVHRRPSHTHDPSRLQPVSAQYRFMSKADGNSSHDDFHQDFGQNHASRSMPASPYGHAFADPTYSPPHLSRAVSAATHYSGQPQHPYQQPLDVDLASQLPRTRRTFPEDSNNPTSSTQRQRPHTWLSPTEPHGPFHNASDVHLFLEATSGLRDGALDGSLTLSPTTPPRLQSSLFERSYQGDSIPTLSANTQPSSRPQSYSQANDELYTMDHAPPQRATSTYVSSSALPPSQFYHSPTPNISQLNLELEVLGLSDDGEPDEELPDYAQSQAEMQAKRRKEATDRARELEARWRSGRR